LGDGQNAGGERGALAGADGVVGDAGRVYHMGGGKTTCLRGVWGRLGGILDIGSVNSDVAGDGEGRGFSCGGPRFFFCFSGVSMTERAHVDQQGSGE
jgi:hypothetical protein